MAILPWTLLMTTMWPLRRRIMEGRRAEEGGKKNLWEEKLQTDVKYCASSLKKSVHEHLTPLYWCYLCNQSNKPITWEQSTLNIISMVWLPHIFMTYSAQIWHPKAFKTGQQSRLHSSLTLSKSNGPKVICFHNIPVNWNVGIQYVATVTDSSIINEDIHLSVTFQDLLCSSVHRVRVSQVKDDGAGSVSLLVGQKRAAWLFHTSLQRPLCSNCFEIFYDSWNLYIRGESCIWEKLFLFSQ